MKITKKNPNINKNIKNLQNSRRDKLERMNKLFDKLLKLSRYVQFVDYSQDTLADEADLTRSHCNVLLHEMATKYGLLDIHNRGYNTCVYFIKKQVFRNRDVFGKFFPILKSIGVWLLLSKSTIQSANPTQYVKTRENTILTHVRDPYLCQWCRNWEWDCKKDCLADLPASPRGCPPEPRSAGLHLKSPSSETPSSSVDRETHISTLPECPQDILLRRTDVFGVALKRNLYQLFLQVEGCEGGPNHPVSLSHQEDAVGTRSEGGLSEGPTPGPLN